MAECGLISATDILPERLHALFPEDVHFLLNPLSAVRVSGFLYRTLRHYRRSRSGNTIIELGNGICSCQNLSKTAGNKEGGASIPRLHDAVRLKRFSKPYYLRLM